MVRSTPIATSACIGGMAWSFIAKLAVALHSVMPLAAQPQAPEWRHVKSWLLAPYVRTMELDRIYPEP